ncbi:hypothetical protein CLV36_11435 [Laceyella sediminis]|uniref:DUF4025 domain-containing protein n=1 Tax=Laceyella sediminis TaxID=573074 RepID=A0ABX5EMU7_9BACL|nr:hypothetical protein [Laceyella sediminis]PRZ12371.1 hypothetical protein CLV36_11435 [Laceyella sediminis]
MDVFDNELKKKHDADVYGVTSDTFEADSDVNEDRNRERQLDESFYDWVEESDSIGEKMKDSLMGISDRHK